MTVAASSTALQSALARDGFAFIQGAAMRELLAPHGAIDDWPAFAASWNHLEVDTYLEDGQRYRRRRHAVFAAAPGRPIERQPHQPHYQGLDYNPLFGGIERWFAPVSDAVASSATLHTILAFCHALFGSMKPDAPSWRIEVHQFRIEARQGQAGRPTPEGLHRDGVDFVLVLLVNRQNINSGITAIHALDGTALGHFTLTEPFDAALVDDARVAHGVTPVEPIDPAQPAFRDVLVVTLKSETRQG